jgi:transposase
MGRRKQHRYSPEFKAEALRLIAETNEPIKKIARELGVAAKTLHDWRAAARPEPREPLSEDERSELQRLRREVVTVRMERDILKKATAFFAKQSE